MLAQAWTVTDPTDFPAVNDYLRSNAYDGVSGHIDFANVSAPVYPIEVSDSAAGVTYQFFQVQDGRHTVIAPEGFSESSFVKAPWMK
jgi:branched-chain amino acid transport system substrate-binding protein